MGLGLAGLLQVAALLVTQAGFGGLASVVDWPTTLLNLFTPNAAVAIFAGLPLGAAVYSVVAFLVLRKRLAPG